MIVFRTKRFFLFSFFLTIACVPASFSHADITIRSDQALTFPDAVSNPSKTGRMQVNWKGRLSGVRNTQVVGDFFQNADFRVISDESSSNTVTINIYSNQDIPGVTLENIKARYGSKTIKTFPASGLAFPATGNGTRLRVGGRIKFTKNVNAELIEPSYSIEITEDIPTTP